MLQIRTICARLSTQLGQRIMLKSIVLQTSAHNPAALKFYEGCGYQRQGLKSGYYGGVSTPLCARGLIIGQGCYSDDAFVAGDCCFKGRPGGRYPCACCIGEELGRCILDGIVHLKLHVLLEISFGTFIGLGFWDKGHV